MLRQPYVIKITIHYTLFVPLALKICDQYFLAGVLTMLYQAISKLRDQLRTVFHVRRQRLLPPPGAKPAFGSTITLDRLKMQLFLPIDYEQWEWLTLRGWRTLDSRQNRRRYYRVPRSAVTRLLHATPDEREFVHQRIVEHKYDKKGWNKGQTATSPQQATTKSTGASRQRQTHSTGLAHGNASFRCHFSYKNTKMGSMCQKCIDLYINKGLQNILPQYYFGSRIDSAAISA
jgi:hypothetical protein